MGELALQGRDKLTYVVSEPISSFGLWVEQLIAESTGKEGKGILPVADEPLGDPDVYGDDRLFVVPAKRGRAGRGAGREGRGARPRRTPDHHLDGPRCRGPREDLLRHRVRHRRRGLGAGDQPVRPAERAGGQGQHRKVLKEGLPELEAGSLDDLLAKASPPKYIAILGYVNPSRGVRRGGHRPARGAARSHEVRDHVRIRAALPALDRAVPQGRTAERAVHPALPRASDDVEIPEAGYSFEHLKNAQALGDMQTLRAHGLEVVRIEVEGTATM